ncbi:MAG TPA: DUF5711 family protein, partial [Mycobacterium sp.]
MPSAPQGSPQQLLPARNAIVFSSLLAPLVAGGPAAPAEPPAAWALLAWARRQFGQHADDQTESTAAPLVSTSLALADANRAPTTRSSAGRPNRSTGVVSGSVTARDPDRDTVSFTAPTTTAKGGTLALKPSRTSARFTYTPSDTARHAAAADGATATDKTDSFTVTVDDGHGHTVPVIVTVDIGAANARPAHPAATVTHTNLNSGLITGTITADDTDHDTFTYSAPATTRKGTIHVNTDGTFTYTPTHAARQAASAPRASRSAQSDSFRATIDDGHGGTTTVTVKIAITPLGHVNVGPGNAVATVGQADATTGVITGAVSVTDPEQDTISYSGSTTTTKGDIVVNTDGTFTYTPKPDALHAAIANDATTAAQIDSFTVTADDGYGGTLDIPVQVSLVPRVTGGSVLADMMPLGTTPLGIALTSDGAHAYVTDQYAQLVHLVNVKSGDVDAEIPVVGSPSRIVLTPDGAFAYVLGSSNIISNSVSVIDTATKQVTTVDIGGTAQDLAVTPDSRFVYVLKGDSDSVAVIQTSDQTVLTDISVGEQPRAIAITNNGHTAYVLNGQSRSISVIDTATNTVTSTIPSIGDASNYPNDIAVSPDGKRLYVTAAYVGSGWLKVYDLEHDNAVLATISPGFAAGDIALSQDGKYAYLPTYSGVTVVDTETFAKSTIQSPLARPGLLAVSPDGTAVYATSPMGYSPAQSGGYLLTYASAPGNTAPTLTVTPGDDADPHSVVFQATGTDVDHDMLTFFSGLGITDLGNGTFKFTPPGIAQATDQPVQFVIYAKDGHGGVVAKTVQVTVQGAEIATASTQPYAQVVGYSPDGTLAYVRGYDGEAGTSSVTVVKVSDGSVVTTFDDLDGAVADRVSLDGQHVYLLQRIDNGDFAYTIHFIVLDTQTGELSTPIDIGELFNDHQYSPDGTHMYAITYKDGEDSIAAIDLQTNTVTYVPVGGFMGSMAISADSQKVYVTTSNSVIVVDAQSNSIVDTITVDSDEIQNVVVGPDPRYLYITALDQVVEQTEGGTTTYYNPSLVIYDLQNDAALTKTSVQNAFWDQFSPDGTKLYLSYVDDKISQIDPQTGEVIATLDVGVDTGQL